VALPGCGLDTEQELRFDGFGYPDERDAGFLVAQQRAGPGAPARQLRAAGLEPPALVATAQAGAERSQPAAGGHRAGPDRGTGPGRGEPVVSGDEGRHRLPAPPAQPVASLADPQVARRTHVTGRAAHPAEPFLQPVDPGERLGEERFEGQPARLPAMPAPGAKTRGSRRVVVAACDRAVAVVEDALRRIHRPDMAGGIPAPARELGHVDQRTEPLRRRGRDAGRLERDRRRGHRVPLSRSLARGSGGRLSTASRSRSPEGLA